MFWSLNHLTNPQGGGKVGYPENEAGHAVRSGRNGVGVQNGLGIRSGFELHPRFPAGFPFKRIEQAGNVFDIVRPVRLGQDKAVEIYPAGASDDGFQVTQEKLGADIIGTHGNDFLAEIQRIERFDDALPALQPLEFVRAGVFKIHLSRGQPVI